VRDTLDETAFRVFLEEIGLRVFQRCRAILRDDHLADEAFQDAFRVLIRKRETIPSFHKAAAWVYKAATYQAMQLRRKQNRWFSSEPREPAATETISDDADVVARGLAGLPDRYREPLKLIYWDGLTRAEAATKLGWPIGRVNKYVVRAMKRLKASLAKLGLSAAVVALGLMLTRDDGTLRLGNGDSYTQEPMKSLFGPGRGTINPTEPLRTTDLGQLGQQKEVQIMAIVSRQVLVALGFSLFASSGTATADWDGDGIPDLLVVKKNAGGLYSVHIYSGASRFEKPLLAVPTAFPASDDVTFRFADYDRDGIPDLIAVKKNAGGLYSVHIYSGASRFEKPLLAVPTAFPASDDVTFEFVNALIEFNITINNPKVGSENFSGNGNNSGNNSGNSGRGGPANPGDKSPGCADKVRDFGKR
jgi:RNA polymerase sigma factor (sigma-70 family)